MRRVLAHRAWPLAGQLAVAAAVAVALAAMVRGPRSPELNAGMYLLWPLWGAALPLLFVVLGRLWCALCPVTLLGDLLDRALPRRPPTPGSLVRASALLSVAALAALHLADLWFHFEEERGATLALLGVTLASATVITAAFRGRGWCQALCPAGALGRHLARLSPLRIAGGAAPCPEPCRGAPCAGGAAAAPLCPVGIDLRTGIDPGSCILCGACVKACPRLGRVGWSASPPPSPGAGAPGESLAALALLGLAVDMALTHLVDWPILLWRLAAALDVGVSPWTETALHATVVASPPLAALLSGAMRRRAMSLGAHLAAASRPALAVAAGALLALATRELLLGGPLQVQGMLRAAGSDAAAWLGPFRELDGLPLRIAQEGLIAAGLIAAFTRRHGEGPGGRPTRTGAAIATGAGALLLWIFSRPMLP